MPKSALMGFSWIKEHRFKSLQIGASKAAVIECLGAPRSTSRTCNLPQRKSFEEAFRGAEHSGAMIFLLWNNGANWYYCVGFDANEQIVFVGEGCS